MKFEVATAKLADLINKAEKLVSRKSSLPILSNIYLEVLNSQLIVRSTNLELGYEASIKSTESVDGSVVVGAGLLKNFLQQSISSKSVKGELDGDVLKLETTNTTVQIATESADDFPSLPELGDEKTYSFKISASDFIEGVGSVQYACAVSTMKPELSSIYLHTYNNELYFVATDTFRLAEKVISNVTSEMESLLIPQANAVEVSKIVNPEGELEFNYNSNLLVINEKDSKITVRVVDGDFPDYRQIIPAEFTTKATVLYYDFDNALRLSSIFTDKYHQVTLGINQDGITVESKGTEQGKSTTAIPATTDGEEITAKFNQRYLNDPLTVLKGDNLVLNLSANKPMIIQNPSDTTFRYLVMPMHQ